MVEPRGDETFGELLRLLGAMERLLRRIRRDLIDYLSGQRDRSAVDQDVLAALNDEALADQVSQYFRALREEQLTEARRTLAMHGLADGSPDVRLKAAVWNAAIRRSGYHDTGEEVVHREDGRLGRLHPVERLKSAKPALDITNTVLESVGKALPPAGALAEIKEAYENVIDVLRGGARGAKWLWERAKFWRRRGQREIPPDEMPLPV